MLLDNSFAQGSSEWMQSRCGLPTASYFDKLLTTKGAPSKSSQKYMYQLAGERITQVKESGYQNAAMTRGIEMEAEAISFYEMTNDVTVERVGLCYRDEQKRVGASPDGLVGDEGMVEIKCPEIHTHVSYMLKGGLDMAYFQQCQGQLLVTGRKWVDLVSYYPGLQPVVIHMERDEKFLAILAVELACFCDTLDDKVDEIRGKK